MRIFSYLTRDTDIGVSSRYFFIWIAGLSTILLTQQLFFYFFHNQSLKTFPDPVLTFVSRWDGGNFLNIAQFGYRDEHMSVFFPFFPYLVRAVSTFTFINPLMTGFMINISATFLIILIFLKLLKLDYDPKTSRKIIRYFLLFPTSFFFLAFYSEALFLLTALSSFYLVRRGLIGASVSTTIITSVTRLAGIAVIPAILIELYEKKATGPMFIAPFTGFILLLLYWYFSTGDPLVFINSEANWNRGPTFPGHALVGYVHSLSSSILNWKLTEVLFTVFALGMFVRTIRSLRISYVIYTLISILIPLSTTNLISMPRFMLVIFPIFIAAGTIKKPIFDLSYILICIILLIIFLVRFNLGLWVA